MNGISYRLDHMILRGMESKYALYPMVLLLCLLVGLLIPNPVTFRWVVIGAVIFLLSAVTVGSVRKGIITILLFLPFMAFLRRALYSVSPYVKFDPIHLIVPALVLFIFVGIVLFDEERFSQVIRGNSLAKYVMALLGVFILQVFNPLQGSLLVGLGGAMYYIIPPMWFYLGRLFIDRNTGVKLLVAIVTIGFIVAVYGIYQTYFGFMAFEEYWIKYGGYVSLNVGGITRAFSTFTSASEYAMYITVCAVIIVATVIYKKKLILLPLLGIILWAIIIEGSRGPVFMFIFTTMALFALRLRNLKKGIFAFILFFFVFVILLGKLSYTPTMFSQTGRVSGVLQHQAMGILDPLTPGRTTLPSHLARVKGAFIDAFTNNPFGYGLGSTTLAAWKFGGQGRGTELDFSDILMSSGVIGAGLYLIIIFHLFKEIIFLCFNSKNLCYPVIFAVLFSTLGHFLTGSNYALVPLLWLLIGWVDKEYVDMRTRAEKRK